MKKSIIFIILLLAISFLIIGCSEGKEKRGFNLDLSEEEKQQMFEEMQQKMKEACQNKTQGDECLLENPRGETSGVCELIDENVICKSAQQRGKFE